MHNKEKLNWKNWERY